MNIKVFFSFKITLPIFFASLLFSSPLNAKVLYGVTLGSNRDLPGGDYSQFYIHSAEECLKRCADEEKCAAYSYNRASQSCRLKDFVPEAVPLRGIVSGYKLSSKSNNKKSSIEPIPVPGEPAIEILSNTDLPGNDFYHTNAENEKKCSQICRENTRCKAFTFDTKKELCWLKERISEKMYSPGHISGLKRSAGGNILDPPVPSAPDMEIMKQTDVPGGDYLQSYQENVSSCTHVCSKDKNCDAFTYVETTKMCKLKSFQPKPRWKRDNVSGIKR